MQRSNLKIGQKVRVIPKWKNRDKPKPTVIVMYVRELSNPTVAGLSRRRKGDVYGILYSVIHPY